MRLTAQQVDADRRQAKAYVDDALREAVCRWIQEHSASRARAGRAFGISVQRVANFQFETQMIKQQAEWCEKMRNSPSVTYRLAG